MASFGRQFSTSSPVLTMSPQPPHQASLGMAGFPLQHANSKPFGPVPGSFAPVQSARPAAAGRKRSRDEAGTNLEPDVPIIPAPEPESEWEYGEGMVLIKRGTPYVTDASSQSGTWIEEKKAADELALKKLQEDRPILRSTKSQRTGLCADISSSVLASKIPSLGADNERSPSGSHVPIIDDFTLHLGIGWRRISDEEHIQAAARGWARFIENHYPVTNARILLESKGLQSYLVETNEGFFLFAENLRQGQLVSQTSDGVLRNLQTSPPSFDGAETLVAAESPKPAQAQMAPSLADTEMRMD